MSEEEYIMQRQPGWREENETDKGQAARSLAAPPCSPALAEKIKAARKLSHDCWRTYHERGFEKQRHYAAGQLDAFDAVLMWIKEAQGND